MKTKDIGMTLLESVNQALTPDQKKIVEGIVNEFRPLYEATLTPQQIANIFGTVEKSGGRTAVGKGVDVAKKANEIINSSLTGNLLKMRGIEATSALANSPNSKVVIIGNSKDGLPIILGGDK